MVQVCRELAVIVGFVVVRMAEVAHVTFLNFNNVAVVIVHYSPCAVAKASKPLQTTAAEFNHYWIA